MVGLHWQLLNIEIICMPNDKSNASLHVLRAYCVSSTILNTYHLVILLSLTTNCRMWILYFLKIRKPKHEQIAKHPMIAQVIDRVSEFHPRWSKSIAS